MAELFAELSGARIVEGRIVIPHVGAWHADLTLDKEVSLASSGLTLVLADLRMTCAPWRPVRPYLGKTRVRVIGGSGGWRKQVPAKGYQATAGIRLSTVLGDLAKACGEKVAVGVDRVLGNHYVREREAAATHLNALVPGSWWIDPDGTTRTGARASSIIASTFSLVSFDGARGSAVVATENPAHFLPARRLKGITLASELVIGGVTHTIGKGSVRTEVLAS